MTYMPNENDRHAGFLVVLEGTDGAGKATHAKLLTQALAESGRPATYISFPNYGSPMAAPTERYLTGAFGTNPEDVDPYVASVFYATDRFGSFREEWGQKYQDGDVIVADRYTTSNDVHQTAKLPPTEREKFLDWLHDLEYVHMALPRPDLVIYLDVDDEVAERILKTRTGKPGVQNDIHERNPDYLAHCKRVAKSVIEREGWTVVRCTRNMTMRSISDIHSEILGLVTSAIAHHEQHAKKV